MNKLCFKLYAFKNFILTALPYFLNREAIFIFKLFKKDSFFSKLLKENLRETVKEKFYP